MKKLLLLCLFVLITSSALISAKDIAYAVENKYTPRAEFTTAFNEMGLTYDIIYSANFSTTNLRKTIYNRELNKMI